MTSRDDISKIIKRIQAYQLWVDKDSNWYFDEKIVSKNQIRCMLSKDLELDTRGKARQKLIDWCLNKCAEVILEGVKRDENRDPAN